MRCVDLRRPGLRVCASTTARWSAMRPGPRSSIAPPMIDWSGSWMTRVGVTRISAGPVCTRCLESCQRWYPQCSTHSADGMDFPQSQLVMRSERYQQIAPRLVLPAQDLARSVESGASMMRGRQTMQLRLARYVVERSRYGSRCWCTECVANEDPASRSFLLLGIVLAVVSAVFNALPQNGG